MSFVYLSQTFCHGGGDDVEFELPWQPHFFIFDRGLWLNLPIS